MTRPRDRYGRPLPEGSRDELRAEPPPRSAAEARRRGIALFNRRRFFEAHECFEHLWKAHGTAERDRDFWKGLAQIAVGCCHVQRGNPAGAAALLERGIGRLRRYPSPHHEIDIRRLCAEASVLAQNVRDEFPRLSLQNR